MKTPSLTTLISVLGASAVPCSFALTGVEDASSGIDLAGDVSTVPGISPDIFIDYLGIFTFSAFDLDSLAVASAASVGENAKSNDTYTDASSAIIGKQVRAYLLHYNPSNTGETSSATEYVDFSTDVLAFAGEHSDLNAFDSLTGGHSGYGSSGENGRGSGFNVSRDAFGTPNGDTYSINGSDSSIFDITKLTVQAPYVDQIYVFTAVPEPGTIAGLAIGAGLFGIQTIRRRRKSKSDNS